MGMNKEKVSEVLQRIEDASVTSEHIGLVNTVRRVRLMFGQRAEFRLESNPDQGTTVFLRIPALNSLGD